MTDALRYLLYSSQALVSETSPGQQAILEAAQSRNAQLGLTGLLHREVDLFFQYLEGPAAALSEVMGLILADPRHEGLRVLAEGACQDRRFGGWSMGFTSRSNLSLFDWMAERAERARSEDPTVIIEFLVACERVMAG